jgi:hypothetical protein
VPARPGWCCAGPSVRPRPGSQHQYRSGRAGGIDQPLGVPACLCEIRLDRIVFVCEDEPELRVVPVDLFKVEGALPLSAG